VSERVGVGVVGCGVIAKAYADKIKTFPHLELVACSDVMQERAEEFAQTHEIPRALSFEKLLDDGDVQAVVNLTVPQAHVEVSAAAIAAGKSVYSEKPLGLDRVDAASLVEGAEAAGVRLGCAPDTFMGAGAQTCRALIDEGAIGRPVAATAFMQSPGPESWHPRPQIFYAKGGGPMFDIGPYYITTLVSLLGPVKRVAAMTNAAHKERTIGSGPDAGKTVPVEVPTHVAGVMELGLPRKPSVIATVITSFDIQATRLRWIEIHGTEATLAVPDPNTFGGRVQIRRAGEREWTEVPVERPHAGESRGIGLADMTWAMRSGRRHRASGELASHCVDVMQSFIDSAEKGRRLKLKSKCGRPAALPADLPEDVFDD
jgi:predicted dehydrogenase